MNEDTLEQPVLATSATLASHRSRLVALASRIAGADAEDVIQEAYLKLESDPVRSRPATEIVAWLRRVSLNLAINRRRDVERWRARGERGEAGKPPEPDQPEFFLLRQEARTGALGSRSAFRGPSRRFAPPPLRIQLRRDRRSAGDSDLVRRHDPGPSRKSISGCLPNGELMTCPDLGTWRSHLDGETAVPGPDEHLATCASCAHLVAGLEDDAEFARTRLATLNRPLAGGSTPKAAPVGPTTVPRSVRWLKRAAAAAVIAVFLATPAGQGAADAFLSVFRVREFNLVQVTTIEADQFAEALLSLGTI